MIFCGIDPGLSGAIAMITESNEIVGKFKMPTIKNVKGKNEIDLTEVVKIFQNYEIMFAILERVHAMPKNGAVSMFTFGRSFGMIEGVIAALKIPYALVSPQTWQKEILKDFNRDDDSKQSSILHAKRMFPKDDFRPTERAKVDDSNITDAVNIALYAKLKFN